LSELFEKREPVRMRNGFGHGGKLCEERELRVVA
jgi:hypothetical protein